MSLHSRNFNPTGRGVRRVREEGAGRGEERPQSDSRRPMIGTLTVSLYASGQMGFQVISN